MTFAKKTILATVLVVIVGVGGWKAIGAYSAWKSEQSLARARQYARSGQTEQAMINLQMSLRDRPHNPEAWKLCAEILEAGGSKEALACRVKVTELLPRDPGAKIECARSALSFNQLAIAQNMVDRVPEDAHNRPEYLEIQAMLASASGHLDTASNSFERLTRDFPGTPYAKNALLNLSKMWLLNDVPGASEQAANRLEELANDPQYGSEARRLLVRRSLKKKDAAAALDFSYWVTETPGARLDDYVLMLDLMRYADCPLYPTALDWVKDVARKNPATAAALAEWIMKHEGPKAAVDWLHRLPRNLQEAKPVPIVLADAYERMKDWSSLQSLLSKQNWGAFNSQKNAFLATAYREDQQLDLARAKWDAAVSAGRSQPGVLNSLAHLAASENRTGDAIDALWKIPPGDLTYAGAQRQLYVYYRDRKDAANLLRLLQRTLEEHPNDPSVKLSVATLLLVRDADVHRAARLAREVYEADPQPLRHAAVYAYSVLRESPSEKAAASAAAILDARSPEERSSDDCLVYYGLILARCHRADEARLCFQKMDRKLLFPEMLEKVHQAEESLE